MCTPHGECRSEEESAEETWSEDPKETVLPEEERWIKTQ